MSAGTPAGVDEVLYPDSDGMPMSDNTLQYQWIVTIKDNLEDLFRGSPDVFVAGDLLWYAVQGNPRVRMAPDVMVAVGRPKGYRGSYRQWLEGGVAPQVVFEVLSPGNTEAEMSNKLAWYDERGVEEYYLYDPHSVRLTAWVRRGRRLTPVERTDGWVSPRLGIRFDLSGPDMVVYRPDGERFLTFVELKQSREEEQRKRETAERQAETERQEKERFRAAAEKERKSAERARQRAKKARQEKDQAAEREAKLAEKLRSLGIDPDAL